MCAERMNMVRINPFTLLRHEKVAPAERLFRRGPAPLIVMLEGVHAFENETGDQGIECLPHGEFFRPVFDIP